MTSEYTTPAMWPYIFHYVQTSALALAAFAAFFAIAERILPRTEGTRAFGLRDLNGNNLFYFFLQTFGSMVAANFFLIVHLQWQLYSPTVALVHFFNLTRHQELITIVTHVLVFDLIFYLNHRFVLHGPLWKAHSVHHADSNPQWITGIKVHPAEIATILAGKVVALVISGVSLQSMQYLVLLEIATTFFSHSNVRMPHFLSRYLVLPCFHKFHHSANKEFHHKNFAALFSFWDVLGGTYIFQNPANAAPYGVAKNRNLLREIFLIGSGGERDKR